MRLGVVILPEHRWRAGADLWRRAEALGFDHAWTYDHLAWRTLRDSPWFAAIPTLTAASLATDSIRIGPLVASPNYRHPIPFAKELATLDEISGGRLTVGIGAGGYGWDATVLGAQPLPPRGRAARFVEFVEVLDGALRNESFSYRGTYFSADEARNPGCVQQPRVPFVIAATGDRGMHVAARFGDGWATTGEGELSGPAGLDQSLEAVRRQVARLEKACRELDRDPATVARFAVTGPRLDSGLGSRSAFRDALDRYRDAGITDVVVHWPRPTEPYAGDVRAFERIVASR